MCSVVRATPDISRYAVYKSSRQRENIMQKYGVVNIDVLNLRAGPSTSAQILTTLKTGAVLEIVADPGFDWLQVKVDGVGTQGYVSKAYLTLTDPNPGAAATPAASTPPSAAPVPTSGTASAPIIGKAEVTTNSLNVRSGPGITYSILTTAAQGTVLSVLQKGGDWIKVRIGTTEGYISAQYVNLNTTKTATGYLIEQADLLVAKLPPDKLITDQTPSTQQAVLARTWNQYGAIFNTVPHIVAIPGTALGATITPRSGGNSVGPDG